MFIATRQIDFEDTNKGTTTIDKEILTIDKGIDEKMPSF